MCLTCSSGPSVVRFVFFFYAKTSKKIKILRFIIQTSRLWECKYLSKNIRILGKNVKILSKNVEILDEDVEKRRNNISTDSSVTWFEIFFPRFDVCWFNKSRLCGSRPIGTLGPYQNSLFANATGAAAPHYLFFYAHEYFARVHNTLFMSDRDRWRIIVKHWLLYLV